MVGLAALGAALVVDAVAERQQPEAAQPFRLPVEAAHRLGEPAERAGREAAEDHPRFPGLAQDRVDPVRAPDAEQADDAAAADVDQVLGEEVAAQVARALLAAEERDVAGLAAVGGEGAVEADDVVVGVAAGRGQEADPRPLGPGQAEHVVVEQGVARLHREAAAAEGDDLTGCRLHVEIFAARRRAVVVQRSEVQPAALAPAYSSAQLVAGAVQPHLHGPFRDAEPAGDRRLGQVLLVSHLQQPAVAFAEQLQRRVQVGELDRRQHLLVLGALAELDRRCRIGADPGVLAEGLVADDRRQPVVAAGGIAQGRAPTPGPEQGILSYVFGLARIARVAIGQSKTDPLCLTPLPAIVVPAAMPYRSVDRTNLHKRCMKLPLRATETVLNLRRSSQSWRRDRRGRTAALGRNRLRGDRARLRRVHRPPQLRPLARRAAAEAGEARHPRQAPARRRLRDRQELHPDARARLAGDRLRHLPGDGRDRPREGRRPGRALGRRHARAAGLRRVRPRLLPRRRGQLPAQHARSSSRR